MRVEVLEQAEPPFTWASVGRATPFVGLVYLLLSAMCFVAESIPIMLKIATQFPWILLALGPPALLVHRGGFAVVYIVTTLVLATFSIITLETIRRMSTWAFLFGGVTLAIWVVGGALTYAPGF